MKTKGGWFAVLSMVVLAAAVPTLLAQSERAQVPVDLAGSTVTVKTGTGSGVNRGITYTITCDASFPLARPGTEVVPLAGAESFIVLRVSAPSLTKNPFTLDFGLDEDKPGIDTTRLHVSADTSFGLRGQGQMPTMVHPRHEITFRDRPGDYGSALLIKNLEVLAFVSKPLRFGGNTGNLSVLVAFEFTPQTAGPTSGGFLEESLFKATRTLVWAYEREFLSSTVKDPKSNDATLAVAKALLERLDSK
jgi:hypothetical protein